MAIIKETEPKTLDLEFPLASGGVDNIRFTYKLVATTEHLQIEFTSEAKRIEPDGSMINVGQEFIPDYAAPFDDIFYMKEYTMTCMLEDNEEWLAGLLSPALH